MTMTACAHDRQDDSDYFADFTRRVTAARIPLDGSIELTHRCNLRCVHCYLGDQDAIRKHHRDEMSTQQIMDLIDEVVDAGALNFTFSGGDPMVRKDFAEVYIYAVKKGLLVTIFCDGVLVSDKIIEVFNTFPPRMVEISIYGASRETYEGITQVKGSFKRCLAGIERLHQNGQRFTLKTVMMTRNRHELEDMRALAKSYGVDFYFDTAIFPCLPHGDNAGAANRERSPASVDVQPPSLHQPTALRVTPDEAAVAQLSDPEKVQEMADLYVRTKDIPDNDRLYVCGAGQTTFHVDPYGNVQPCTISTNVDYNIRNGGFLKGWNGPVAAIRDIRISADNSCRSCDKQSLCSGCPAMFMADNGVADQKSDYICRTTHALFEGIKDSVSEMLERPS
ncbi:MAG: radical SAM protein [Gammaproteobacteria bacterium]|nr:radical SAM protein [Gammaproteobacteria bacterium]MDX2459300.1 radical SAM protein [Gammaproteobacteria bacterium]